MAVWADSRIEAADVLFIDVKADDPKICFAGAERKWETDIAEPDDADHGISTRKTCL